MEAEAHSAKRGALSEIFDAYFEAHPSLVSAGEAIERLAVEMTRRWLMERLDESLGTYPLPSDERITIVTKLAPPKESQP